MRRVTKRLILGFAATAESNAISELIKLAVRQILLSNHAADILVSPAKSQLYAIIYENY